MTNVPSHTLCPECRDIARVLRDAWLVDRGRVRTRLAEVAASSSRDVQSLGVQWVFSVAAMPDAEMKALLDSHYPCVTVAMRRRQQHESMTGHSLKGWYMWSLYGLDRL